MTREHRSVAVDLVPAAVRRSFTLREYARLLGLIDARSFPPARQRSGRAHPCRWPPPSADKHSPPTTTSLTPTARRTLRTSGLLLRSSKR